MICKGDKGTIQWKNDDLSDRWPFNRKEEPAVPQTAKTLIYIPGTWEGYEHFRDAIISVY